MKIAIVGATGNVGRKIIEVLEQKKLLVEDLCLLASKKSAGTELLFNGKKFCGILQEVIKFDKLGKDTMKSVVKKFLLELNSMTSEKDVEVNATDEAIEFLMTKGFDAKLGARPLQRVIDDEIKKPLSKMMLFGELTEGGMVEVGISDDVVPKLTVNFKAKKEPKTLDAFKPKVSGEKASQ